MSTSGRTAVLVDQHPMWLDAVDTVLTGTSTDVVGKTTSFVEATNLIDELRPDIVVVETSMSEGEVNGVSWLADTAKSFPDVKVIVLSTSDEPADISVALSSGAVAYVVKTAHPDDLAVAIRQVYEHSIYLPRMMEGSPLANSTPSVDQLDLTRRELEILRFVAEGMSNAELAKLLWVTEQTIKFHLSNIYRKLNVSNRTEASRWAQVHGLLPATPVRSLTAA